MIKQTIAGTYHAISILALMAFNPALLFQKINALPWYQEALHNWLASVSINKGDTLLEAGCATGQLVQYMSSRGVIVHGVDKSAQMLQQAHKFNTDAATFALASVMDLPYESNRFDFIIAASLINVVAEPEIALREMVRVCKPGGKVSVLVPQAGMSDEDVDNLATELNLSGFSRATLMTWHKRARKMDRDKLLDYFNLAGLYNINSETYLNGLVITVTGKCRV